METGATDGRLLRGAGIPTYGVSGVFLDDLDNRSHGRDERVGVRDYYDGLAFNYQLDPSACLAVLNCAQPRRLGRRD